MKVKAKVFIFTLIAVLAISVSGSVLAQDEASCAGGEDVTITFMNWWGATREPLMNQVIENFNEICPNITVENSVQAFDNREELIATTVASSNPPNLIMAGRVETYQFAFQGFLEPIDDYVAASGINPDEIFYASEINNQRFNGELYAMPLPTAGGISGLYLYNKTMFEEAGLDPANPPQTWQDLEEVEAAITETDGFGLMKFGVNILGGDASELYTPFTYWLYTNNGTLFSEDGRTVTFNSPEGVETLEWMVNFVNTYDGGIEAVREFMAGTPDLTTADNPFYTEDLAIVFENVSAFGHLANTDPEMWENTDAWGIALRPYNGENPDAKSQGVSGLAFSWGYIIPTNQSDVQKQASYEFMEYLTTADDGGCYFVFEQGRPSPIKACNEREAYYEANPYWDTVLESLAIDVSVPVTPIQAQINDILNRAVEEAFFGADAATVLDSAAVDAQALLDDFWSSNE
ncbi:ABC transporter substrate-binding protein [Phototrophicus methaneseepsis]|uniref:ABC transporter substrate-binding protein n=1 Tax=Phototrophicus methaneseepsis TaxID=2710758 RepID=A0A7S8EAE7_9CHLR|nr:ABC transporter substrate-binding protein [Phototrophicus methaneseepsis]QPC83350.1 ABC transporter substrate-binding protein [Phototrophicus methaneseepsis]